MNKGMPTSLMSRCLCPGHLGIDKLDSYRAPADPVYYMANALRRSFERLVVSLMAAIKEPYP